MACETKVFVATKKENIINVMPKLINDLNKWQQNQLDTHWEEKGFKSRLQYLCATENNDFTNGVEVNSCDFNSFTIDFKVRGEQRSVFVTHKCSMDYSDVYEGEKMIFSLNMWGMHKEIMNCIAESIKEFGEVYYTENDCYEKFVKIY